MLTLAFVRHGRTECSRQHRFCGERDVPIDDHGEAVARAFAEFHGDDGWDAIYSSPKLRTRQTAAPLVERTGLPLRLEEGLREIAYGEWDGLLESEARERDPERFRAWNSDPAGVSPPGGESAGAIALRAMPVVDAIRKRHPSGRVVAFSHKATIRVVVCALLGIDLSLFRVRVGQSVGALTMFEFRESGPLLVALNDTSHVPPELREEGS